MVSMLIMFSMVLIAQPSPGDVYKEYLWFNDMGDCGGALRVGGSLDYRLTGKAFPLDSQGHIVPKFELDLENALKAELVVEKMLCYGGTIGLRVSINDNDPVPIPESANIKSPQSDYAHHFSAVFPIELSNLKEGLGNHFDFNVDTTAHWWPQNLVYGMVLRVYYEPFVVAHRSQITIPASGDQIGMEAIVEFDHPNQEQVRKIDLVGYYADLEGNGLYQKWHYAYHTAEIYNHVASLELLEKRCTWNTEWLPEQAGPMKLAAFIHLKNGYSYMTDVVEELQLHRPGYSVELCKPYQRPKGWFTREGEFSERFQVKGDPEKITEAKMVFRTWSPGYFNGIYINDFIVFTKEGPRYDYYLHDILIEKHVLQQGGNVLKTGKTPLYHGEMVHGVEVQWPGIMLKIRYDLN